jgi:hypothetical protein
MLGSKLSVQQINYVNIGLMVVSAACALMFPFETFLFVYAFLGPLHYLTEISWLHDRQYFTKSKYDYIPLVLIGVVITLLYFGLVPNAPAGTASFLTYMAFAAALVFVTVKKPMARVAYLAVAAFAVLLFGKSDAYQNIFGVFLPTLIHVFIFTALFILVGALKGRDVSALLSLVVFAVCTTAFFFYRPDHSGYTVSEYVRNSFGYMTNEGSFSDGFVSLNYMFMKVFRIHDFDPRGYSSLSNFVSEFNTFLYSNPLALSVMSFIAFAYMYHYLNWFSKTSVIQWHNIPRSRLIGVVALWLGSIALYAYDYRVGLKWLFFLSFSHVLLEFPLNHITFINIGKEIKNIVTTGKFAKAAPVPVSTKPSKAMSR